MEAGLTEISGLWANRLSVLFIKNDELRFITEVDDGFSPRFKASRVKSRMLMPSPDVIRLAAFGSEEYELKIIARLALYVALD